MRGIVWFREDLRVYDNTALSQAALTCCDGVIGVFALDAMLWQKHHVAACRVDFILRGLQALTLSLEKLNIPLIILPITDSQLLPQELFKLAQTTKAKALFFNQQYEINESRRDQAVEKYFLARKKQCYSYHDQLIIMPGSIKTKTNKFFTVFTPYKRTWQKNFLQQPAIALAKIPKSQAPLSIDSSPLPTQLAGFTSTIAADLWPAGEKSAQRRLQEFIKNKIGLYDKQRDLPAVDGTSKLSPYLACGMISARYCFITALKSNQNELDTGNNGIKTWLTELIWRDFYKTLLIAFPRLAMHQPFQQRTRYIAWESNEQHLLAWQQGKTGIPIIDAAMRQLTTCGWMHNRLRMLTAMFFSKNLLLDWRQGEDYFMRHLIDGDLAANNGGWQWSASTGTDAVPYFRIFNPIRQSERFDPEGAFIRQYCPELAHLTNKAIHDPHTRAPLLMSHSDYPKPIINIDESRKKAIAVFKQLSAISFTKTAE